MKLHRLVRRGTSSGEMYLFNIALESLQESGERGSVDVTRVSHNEIGAFIEGEPIGLPPFLNQFKRTGLAAHLKHAHSDAAVATIAGSQSPLQSLCANCCRRLFVRKSPRLLQCPCPLHLHGKYFLEWISGTCA